MNQEDYTERKRRMLDNAGDDEDARLVALYESQGYEWDGSNSGQSPEPTSTTKNDSDENSPSTAPSTESHLKRGVSKVSGTARTAEKSGGQVGR